MTDLSTLPAEIHSSVHQVRYDGSLIAEYEVRIYRGVEGPVIVLEGGSSSPLPLDYVSEIAVRKFLEQAPISRARFFERHVLSSHEAWFEVGFERGTFYRVACPFSEASAAIVEPVDTLRGHREPVGQSVRRP